MPDLGIGEAIALLGGAGLFGGEAAAGAGIGAGLAGGGSALAAGGAELAGLAGLGAGAAGLADASTAGGAAAAPIDAGGGIGTGLAGGGSALAGGGGDLAGLAGAGTAGLADLSGAGAGGDILPTNATLTSGTTPSDIVSNGFADLNPTNGATPVTTTPASPLGPLTAGGVTSVGPNSGIPSSVLSNAGLSPAGVAPASPIAAGAGTGGGFDLSSLGSFAKDYGPLLGAGVGAAGLGYSILNANQARPSTQAIQGELASLTPQLQNAQNTANQISQQGASLTNAAQGIVTQGTTLANQNATQGAGLTAQGQGIVSQGQALTQPAVTGVLPPQYQAQVDQAIASTKAHIISNYASQGMNTDPNRNSSLRQELAAVDQQGVLMAAQLEQQLLQGGTSLIGSGSGLIGQGGALSSGAASNLTGTGANLNSTGANLTAVGATDLINAGLGYSGLQSTLLSQLSNIDQTQTANIGKAISSFAAALAGNRPTVNINTNAANQNTPGTITATAG